MIIKLKPYVALWLVGMYVKLCILDKYIRQEYVIISHFPSMHKNPRHFLIIRKYMSVSVLGASLSLCSGDEEEKQNILDELLDQARAARDQNEEPHREANELLRERTSDTDASSYSMLDHLLDKAMKEKVSRESEPGFPADPDQENYYQNSGSTEDKEDPKQKSRFKYLFFEILTPDEYNDIIYLGEDLLNPMEEKLNVDSGPLAGDNAEKRSEEKLAPVTELKISDNNYQSKLAIPEDNARVDERKNKMENLLRKMTDRYNTRTQSNFQDSSEETKTKKLKNMIEILEDKLDNYQPQPSRLKEVSSRRIDSEPSYLQQMAERGIQKSRTTPSSYQSSYKYKYTTTASPSDKKIKEKWNNAMETLSDKISRMGSGIHRLNLDEMLDLDMLEVPDDDQKSSDSYPGTTAVPPSNYYDSQLREKKVPKRQVSIHPKLTFQRQDFGDVHRPSSKLKDLIREKEERISVSPGPGSAVKTLPPISRYHEQEPVYKPTSSFLSPDECPYIPARPYSECYNAPPSECQTIGYPDPACAPGSLCCYDGCINLCWRNPALPPKLPPLAPPPAQYSTTTSRPKVYGYTTTTPAITTTEPIFYHPAPRDFQPKVGPNPVAPVHVTPPPRPPPGYLPPLQNTEGHVKDGKALHPVPTPTTLYPPPSQYFQQPSISFIAKGESGQPHHSSHSTVTPAHYYKEAKSLEYTSNMQHYQVPSKGYLGMISI